MTGKKLCSAMIYGDYPPHHCQMPAKVERDGKWDGQWYCTVHDPLYVQDKKDKRSAKLIKEDKWIH